MRTSPVHYTCRVLLAIAACWLAGSAAVQAMPAIQHWQTDNGARVYYVPAPELPIVDVRMVFSAGSARDAGQPGLARMTNHLLDQGAAGLSANDIADTLEGLGAELDRIKAQTIAGEVYKQDSIFYQGMVIGKLEPTGMSWRLKDEFVERINAVTAVQVQAVAKIYLYESGLTVAVLEPLPMDSEKTARNAATGGGHAH